MSKVAIVGVEGSGKTVLMGALCECYKQGAGDEPYLMPENQAAFMFMERVPHLLRVERQWPEATNISSLKSMKWTLRMGNEILEEIEMLDYPGELYRIAFGEHTKAEADAHRAELDEFLAHLTEADVLAVLVSPEDVKNIGNDKRKLETVWITRGIFDFAEKLPKVKRKFLVFTQADRYKEELKAAGGPNGLYAHGLPMMKTLYPGLDVTAISAVGDVDFEGRPMRGYSAEGCSAFMRKVIAETDTVIQTKLEECATLWRQIKGFNAGHEADYLCLLEKYIELTGQLKKLTRPLHNFYRGIVQTHQFHADEICVPLVACVKRCAKNKTWKEKANPATWQSLIKEFDGCEGTARAITAHYLKTAEQVNRENKAVTIVFVIVCLIVLTIIGHLVKITSIP